MMVNIKFENENQEVIVVDGVNLRFKVLENCVDIYIFMVKLMNCGGYGQCGICVVEIIEGLENFLFCIEVEEKKLKKRFENWRLVCQVLVNGFVVVKIKLKCK